MLRHLRAKFKFITALITVSIFSCGCTFISSTEMVNGYTFEEIDLIIKDYETNGTEPQGYRPISWWYVRRSICYAHLAPSFKNSRACLWIGWEVPEVGFVFILMTPIAFAFDVLYLPIQGTKTLLADDERLAAALSDLQRARELGYDEDYFYYKWAEPEIKHLDRCGYSLDDHISNE